MDPPPLRGEVHSIWEDAGRAYHKGDMGRAAELYTQALRRRPGEPRLLGNRSAALLGMGDVAGALDDAVSCVRSHPLWAKGHVRAALAYRASGRHSEALEHLERAKATDPYNTEVLTLLTTTESESLYQHAITRVDSPRSPSRSPEYYDKVRTSVRRKREPPTASPPPTNPGGHRITCEDGTTFTTFFTSPKMVQREARSPRVIPVAPPQTVPDPEPLKTESPVREVKEPSPPRVVVVPAASQGWSVGQLFCALLGVLPPFATVQVGVCPQPLPPLSAGWLGLLCFVVPWCMLLPGYVMCRGKVWTAVLTAVLAVAVVLGGGYTQLYPVAVCSAVEYTVAALHLGAACYIAVVMRGCGVREGAGLSRYLTVGLLGHVALVALEAHKAAEMVMVC